MNDPTQHNEHVSSERPKNTSLRGAQRRGNLWLAMTMKKVELPWSAHNENS